MKSAAAAKTKKPRNRSRLSAADAQWIIEVNRECAARIAEKEKAATAKAPRSRPAAAGPECASASRPDQC